jgi:phenylacetic acid degradation operon negative regulatory protein
VLADLGLVGAAWSFVATAGQIGSERSLVRSAWDLDAIESRYEEFLDLVGTRRPRTGRQALVAQIRLVQAWRRFPLLRVFRERHAAWAPRAQAAWEDLAPEDGRGSVSPAGGGGRPG